MSCPTRERGAVTVELAMALPLLLAVTAGLAWLLYLGVSQARVTDAARETARSVARGDDVGRAVGLGNEVAPSGSAISVSGDGEVVRATAQAELIDPGSIWAFLPSVTVSATAVALREGASP